MRDQLDPLVEGIRAVLGANAVGAYLHGSAVLGGLKPRSDIDVVVVTKRSMTLEERRGVIAVLLELSGKPRPIELDVVVQSEIKPWRFPPRVDFHYFELNRPRFERGELEPWANAAGPGLAAVITMALAGDAALFGPPPGEVFDPVPRRDYQEAVVSYVAEVDGDLESDTRNVILTLARIWSALATEHVHSKDSAAVWALTRLPAEHRPVLERARAIYRGEAEEFWDDVRPQVNAYVAYLVSEIDRATPA
jgi:predicted nucleotidyltransferase